MKRIFAILTVLLISLTACSTSGSVNTSPVIPQKFESDLKVVFKDSEITAHWIRDGLGENTIEMLSPNTIDGVILKIKGNDCTITYGSLMFNMDFSRFPQTAFGVALVNSFDTIIKETKITGTQKDNDWEYKGENSSGSFIMRQNGKTGFIDFFSIPSLDLTVQFSDFKEIK